MGCDVVGVGGMVVVTTVVPTFTLTRAGDGDTPISMRTGSAAVEIGSRGVIVGRSNRRASIGVCGVGNGRVAGVSRARFMSNRRMRGMFIASPFVPRALDGHGHDLRDRCPAFFFNYDRLPNDEKDVKNGGRVRDHSSGS